MAVFGYSVGSAIALNYNLPIFPKYLITRKKEGSPTRVGLPVYSRQTNTTWHHCRMTLFYLPATDINI
jgi:hypothetical protein